MTAVEPIIVGLDQGTTSTRAIAFDGSGQMRAEAQRELTQYFPGSGLVEHDAEEIWESALFVTGRVIAEVGTTPVAIGITNQRETVVVWDRASGHPIHRAIVWQDRRTAEVCRRLAEAGHGPMITARTGLIIDPYFSATKIVWLLDQVPGARERAERGELAFGTVDSFLIYRLTDGHVHATDATNAARTLLFDIHRQAWDDELLALFDVPAALLPEVKDCAAEFGVTDGDHFGASIPIRGVAGDQQAATVGQACFAPGDIKSTYGTGCFAVLNTGEQAVTSSNRLLTGIAYRLEGRPTYALEGSIFVAGAAVQWLRDGLGLIQQASDTEQLARDLDGNGGVYLVPAFTGLGAPWWDTDARASIFGLTRDTGPAHLVRAGLEAVAYQTRDLFDAMTADGAVLTALRVDGGMIENDWLVQFLADLVELPVERPVMRETTALGVAFLAGLQAGVFTDLDDIAACWRLAYRFEPAMAEDQRAALLAGWHDAVQRTLSRRT